MIELVHMKKKSIQKIEEIKIHLNYIDKLNESELSRIFRGINQGSIVKVEEVKRKKYFCIFRYIRIQRFGK